MEERKKPSIRNSQPPSQKIIHPLSMIITRPSKKGMSIPKMLMSMFFDNDHCFQVEMLMTSSFRHVCASLLRVGVKILQLEESASWTQQPVSSDLLLGLARSIWEPSLLPEINFLIWKLVSCSLSCRRPTF